MEVFSVNRTIPTHVDRYYSRMHAKLPLSVLHCSYGIITYYLPYVKYHE